MTDMLELFGALKPEERAVKVGDVPTWDTGCTVREQAIKVLEEAAEVFGAFQRHEAALDAIESEWPREQCDVKHRHREEARESKDALKDECADVITATCNLLAMLGVEDARGIMAECAKRQRERGRL